MRQLDRIVGVKYLAAHLAIHERSMLAACLCFHRLLSSAISH